MTNKRKAVTKTAAKTRAKPLIRGGEVTKHEKAVVKAAVVEALTIPAALLLAGEAIASKASKEMTMFHGVLIHQVDQGHARVIARDGYRLFVASFKLREKAPTWLKDGLLLSRDSLKARLTMLTRVEEAQFVQVSYAAKTRDAELSDLSRSAVMKVNLGNPASFPGYDRAMSEASFNSMNQDGEVDRRDWQAVGFSSKSLKHCSDIAKILEAGLNADDRPAEGMVIRAFQGRENAPKAFDFPAYPGALLLLQPVPIGSLPLAAETAAVVAPAVKLTCAALRAHAKRWIMRADATTNEAEKAEHMARAANFTDRVNALLAKAPGVKDDLPLLEGVETPQLESKAATPTGTDKTTVH